MNLDDVKAMPVADIADADCALFMWATDPLLPEAIETIKAIDNRIEIFDKDRIRSQTSTYEQMNVLIKEHIQDMV